MGTGDLAVRARQAFANVGRALTAAGALPAQVAKITIYLVHHRPEYLPDISAARIATSGDHKPADTLVGVGTLAEPDYLIEVEAILTRTGATPTGCPELFNCLHRRVTETPLQH